MGLVEQIERLRVGVEGQSFAEREPAAESDIEVRQSIAAHDISSGVAEVIRSSNRESRRIEPAIGGRVGEDWITQQVRAIGSKDASAVSRIAVVEPQDRRQGL